MKQKKTISEKLKDIRESTNWKNSPESIKQITKIIDALLKKVMSLNEETKEKKQDNYLQQQHNFLEKEVEMNRIVINELVKGYKDIKEKNVQIIETVRTFKNILREMNNELINIQKEPEKKETTKEELPYPSPNVNERVIAIDNYYNHTEEFTAYEMSDLLDIPISTVRTKIVPRDIKAKKIEQTNTKEGQRVIYRSLIIDKGDELKSEKI